MSPEQIIPSYTSLASVGLINHALMRRAGTRKKDTSVEIPASTTRRIHRELRNFCRQSVCEGLGAYAVVCVNARQSLFVSES